MSRRGGSKFCTLGGRRMKNKEHSERNGMGFRLSPGEGTKPFT